MSKVQSLLAAVAASALALPVLAGGPPFPYPAWKGVEQAPKAAAAATATAPQDAASRQVRDFEYVGGDAGWQLVQHHYIVVNGRFEHASDCDHEMRMAERPGAGGLGDAQYPGA